jgi:hypothetical protein
MATATPGSPSHPAALAIAAIDCNPLCNAAEWTVADEPALARAVAQLAAGHAEAVRAALLSLSFVPLKAPPRTPTAAAIAQLEARKTGVGRYHRDGWLFQLIAWIAAIQTLRPGDLVRAPQPQMAQHGIDGLVVHLDVNTTVEAVTICEQKASGQPRKTITAKVWPGLAAYERAERDNQLLHEVTVLLTTQPTAKAVELADAILWQRARRYQAAVTIKAGKGGPQGLSHLFKGFDTHVVGDTSRRCGEALHLPSLRAWMDGFAQAVLSELRLML